MVSKNNKILHLRKSATKVSKYKIKKLSVGVASVLVGATFFLGSTTSASASDEQLADKQAGVTQQTDQNATNTNDRVLKFDNATSTATTDNADSSAAKMSNVAQADNSANNATVANNLDKKSITDSTLSNNNDLKSTEMQSTVADQAAADDANTADQTATEKQATVTNQATVDNTVNTADQATQAVAEKTTTPASTAANTQAAAPVATLRAAATADTSTTTTVNNWTGLINALNNPYYQTITVDGTINAMGTGTVEGNDRTVVIKGADQNASIDFGSTPLTVNGTMQLAFENLILKTASANGAVTFNNSSNTSTVTFKDVTHSGASLYGGSGNAAVVIDGTTTSTVSTSSKPTAKTYSANGNGANIWGAKSVTVANGANFTLNRSAIGDGINLPDGATVQVGDNATMTVNLNTDNGTESARYHDAGIFMLSGGNFLTGRNAVVNMNTSIGQAVSIGADRPGIGVTAADRFGGYGTSQSRNAGPTAVTFGDYSQFNFTGRDGFILGNNANFTSGEYSNVHFQNQGRGVALDLANNSNIVISKHSNTLFESNGKTGTSGSYDGYNYIGVNEGGNITVDEYATFRVILTGRGDNPWDDVVSLDSRNSKTNAAFTSKKGAVVDIRDDNTNFYAELISFPLGTPNSVIDIQDPLYLNLQRYSAGGATTGWMPVGGTDINSTSAAYTANLIYMGGTKGVLTIGGTNYVVYQQIKSDGAQQIWLNVDAVEFDKEGFAAKDIWNNGANSDSSIEGVGLTADVLANYIKDNQTSPTAKGTAPYYGISTMRASHQIWFPHSTEIQAAGQHQNIIKYVYEDGTEAAPTVTQTVDMTRDITLDLTADQIETVKSYAATHSADETLNYIKNLYVVAQDSGWQVAEGDNTQTAYDAVTTPEIAGYTASIQSTTANGVVVGGDAATVHATLDIPEDAVISNGKLSEAYLNNGGAVTMPANYETVVVYQKEIQNQPVTIIYQDKSENNKILATDDLEGKPGTALDYSTADKIQSFIDKGYKLVSDDVPSDATFGDEPQTYYVTLEHDIAPVGPNNPHEPGTPVNPNDPDGPKWPNQDQYTKDYTSTVEFVDDQGNKMPGLDDNVQTSTWTRTLNVDKVTGDILNPAEPWTPDKSTYDKVNVPVVPGYYADQPEVPAKATVQENITDKVVYKPMGKIIPVDPSGNPIPDAPTPQYPNDPTDPTKTTPNQPVPEIPGMTPEVPSVTPENPGKDTPVVYNPVVEKHSLTERFVDEAGNELAPSEVIGTDYVKNDKYNVTGDAKVIDGYYLTAVPSNAEGTFGDENVTVTFTYAKLGKIIPVDPSGNPIPDAPTPQYPNDPTDPTKTTPNQPVPEIPGMTPEVPSVTPENPGKDTPVVYNPVVEKHSLTERFVDEAGNELAPSEVIGTDYVKNDKYNVTGDAKVIDGYYLTAVPSNAEGTFGDENVTVTFTYAKLGKIIPVDPSGNPIPDAPTPQYPNDPTDPTKTTPNQPVPEIPGMTPEVPSVTPENPGKDTPVVYNPVVEKHSLTERFVDEAGNELAPSEVIGTDYVKNDKYNVTGDAKVIDGYYLTAVPSNAEGTFGDENVTVTFTYAKLGKIIPVDPSGNPIPDAPTPQYPNDPTDPTKTTPNQPVPEIPGMTPEVPSVTPENPGKDTPVVYEMNKHSLTERFVDEAGQEISSTVVKGTEYVKNDKYNVTGDAKVIDGYYLTAVPSNAEGTFGDENVTVTFTYAKLGKIVPVDPSGNPIPDAPTPQYPNDPTDPTKTTPNQPVPEIPGMTPEVPTVTPNQPGEDTPVVYVPVVEGKYSLIERFVDEAGQEISSTVVKGTDYVKNDKYNVTGDAKVIDGYYLTAVPSNAEGTFGDDNVTVTFTYAKLGKIIPVDPSGNPIPDAPTPQYPNDPTNPTKTTPNQPVPEIPGMTPEVPSVTPENPGKDTPVVYEMNKHSLTERFVDEAGNELAPSKVVGKDYVKDQKYNVTGDAKVIDGYYLTAVPSNAEGTFGDDNVTVTFTYAKLGKIIPVDPSGNPIPDAPTPQYPNDPTNPTKTTPNQPVPEIPGMTPQVPSVTPENPGKDTPVVYEMNKHSLTERFVDETGNELAPSEVVGKDYVKNDKYNVTDDAKVIDGYYLTAVPSNAEGTFGDEDVTVTFTYAKLGKIIPVDPSGNPIPDAPTPQYPNDPTDPTKTTPNQPVPEIPGMTPQVPSVTPENPGKDTPVVYNPVVEKHSLTERFVDEAGNELEAPVVVGTDYVKNDKYNVTGDAKVIDGYYLTAVPSNAEGTFGDEDVTVTFTYAKLGKIIPVDPSGNPIPDAPTPQYPNDPTDPTKTTPNQPVPTIPGMNPEVPAVTPNQPGQDTPVTYVPVVPEKQLQTAKIVYVDTKTGKTLETDTVTGKSGEKIDYSTTPRIDEWRDKGYRLVEDGFAEAGTPVYDDNDDVEQIFIVKLDHDTAPVGPNDPHEPGTPINPSDPNGPKWPAKDSYTKQYTSTVHFVDENGNKLHDDNVQTSTWTRTLIVDKATGEILNPDEAWHSDIDKYSDVKVDPIKGYYTDRKSVPGEVAQQQDIVNTVVYKQIGKIVPVDPSGNPIPDAPTPQYPNDPTDPTKTTPNQPVPEIPGMTPQTPVVTPENPGQDTPVVYNPVVEKYSLTERFVDEAGNELEAPVVKGTDYVKNDKYNVTGDAKVIEGYYLTAIPSNAEGTIGDDNVTVTFTYAKLGKIVPVDPSGNPIPDAPTPQYRNDPNDPTKVIVTNTPEIPGMTPEVPSVTPENPGEDTPVVYNKVETPTPKTVDVTPETPKAVDVTSETPKATPVKTAPQVEKVKAPELPQTGEKQNNALTAVGASIMTGLLGILAFAKKKKDDKEI